MLDVQEAVSLSFTNNFFANLSSMGIRKPVIGNIKKKMKEAFIVFYSDTACTTSVSVSTSGPWERGLQHVLQVLLHNDLTHQRVRQFCRDTENNLQKLESRHAATKIIN